MVDPTVDVPESVGEVEIYVPPYAVGPQVAEVMPRMTSLRYVQTLTAGVDNIRAAIPAGVTLCSGRGIHDTSTAELVLTLVLASLRGVPSLRARPGPARVDARVGARRWRTGRCCWSGTARSGTAVEARLTPFECAVVRVARSARDGVHADRGAARRCCRTPTSWSSCCR